jgi:hypothetical protein
MAARASHREATATEGSISSQGVPVPASLPRLDSDPSVAVGSLRYEALRYKHPRIRKQQDEIEGYPHSYDHHPVCPRSPPTPLLVRRRRYSPHAEW